MNKIFSGKIEKGRLVLDTPEQFSVYISRLEGREVTVSVQKYQKNRSLPQNSFYWGVIIEIIANHCGYFPDEMHEALKEKFLSYGMDSHGLKKIKSTATLTTDEFINYTNRIVIWAAAELGVYIPDPRQIDFKAGG